MYAIAVPLIYNDAPIERRVRAIICGDCYLERPIHVKLEDRGVCLNCFMRVVEREDLEQGAV